MGILDNKAANIRFASPAASPGKAPSKKQIYRCRQNYGVNIGSCFVLEKWIFDEMFPAGTNNELEVVSRLTKDLGKDRAREKFERYWNNFMKEDDWRWMQSHKVTSVRIPLGYWNVGGGRFVRGTRFESYAGNYVNSWKIFKSKFVEVAGRFNIAVIVDVHSLPYGANGESHSGEKNGGSADFWNNETVQLLMLELLAFIAGDLKGYDNISGIQIVNESEFSWDISKRTRYYAAAINLIREKDSFVPIVVSDGWSPEPWIKWVQQHQNDENTIGVVLDHHCYRCFLPQDRAKNPQQIIDALNNDMLSLPSDGVDIMVGEYCCVMDPQSWNQGNFQARRDELVVRFGRRQTELMAQRANVGTYFWTLKFQSGDGGEFDFRKMTAKGALYPPPTIRVPDRNQFDQRLKAAFNSHVDFWKKTSPNEKFEHDRYRDGFTTAWNDSVHFAEFNGSTIAKRSWKTARFQEHVKARGKGKYAWEWHHGFDAGLANFKK